MAPHPPSSIGGELSPLTPQAPAELASICSQADALRAELSALLLLGNPAKNEELLTIFLRAGREIEELLARLNALSRAFAQEAVKISRELEELAQKKELLQAQAGEMRAKVSAAQAGYESKVRALEEQIEALQSRRRILETNSRIQASRLEQAEEDLNKSRTDHRLAEKKCLAFQERALEIEENRAALSRQNASLQGALDELRRQVAQ
ncbi:MAG: hypothetical protein HY551_00615, partial [Elusimicrobia bacterium]|nr:hypothetical protein [Elusimicrobiota bacterium]